MSLQKAMKTNMFLMDYLIVQDKSVVRKLNQWVQDTLKAIGYFN